SHRARCVPAAAADRPPDRGECAARGGGTAAGRAAAGALARGAGRTIATRSVVFAGLRGTLVAGPRAGAQTAAVGGADVNDVPRIVVVVRSEEHTSELQ